MSMQMALINTGGNYISQPSLMRRNYWI